VRRALAFAAVLAVVGAAVALSNPQTGTSGDGSIFSRQVGCGVERWGVKTLTDRAARRINFTPKQTTVRALRRLPAPATVFGRSRIRGVETTTYRIRATLVQMKLEEDSDIHLVIADPRNLQETMIIEFPDPACARRASLQARTKMRKARVALINACGSASSSSFQQLRGAATISGVGFFDLRHGQTGVAPNGIELHPVLSFTRSTCERSSPVPPPPPPPPGPPTPPPPPGQSCHPSYPTVCIPPPPPDLDCGDIAYRNFQVRWDVADPDPHQFDGNKDGIGCQT
jgi:hypothetical protein